MSVDGHAVSVDDDGRLAEPVRLVEVFSKLLQRKMGTIVPIDPTLIV